MWYKQKFWFDTFIHSNILYAIRVILIYTVATNAIFLFCEDAVHDQCLDNLKLRDDLDNNIIYHEFQVWNILTLILTTLVMESLANEFFTSEWVFRSTI